MPGLSESCIAWTQPLITYRNPSEDCDKGVPDPMDQDPPAEPASATDAGDLSQYNLGDYDKDLDSGALGPFTNLKGLTYYRNNEEDPYITLKDVCIHV